MAKEKKNNSFDTFAWLICKQVEEYINTHQEEYKVWAQENSTPESGSDESSRKNQKGDRNNGKHQH